jgi:hypothetical protein
MNPRAPIACLAVTLCATALLAACGKTGALYLPERGGEVVTRPSQTPPAADTDDAASSPQTVDSPAAPANPAPEVTPPSSTEPVKEKKKDGAAPPPAKQD